MNVISWAGGNTLITAARLTAGGGGREMLRQMHAHTHTPLSCTVESCLKHSHDPQNQSGKGMRVVVPCLGTGGACTHMHTHAHLLL